MSTGQHLGVAPVGVVAENFLVDQVGSAQRWQPVRGGLTREALGHHLAQFSLALETALEIGRAHV